MTDAKEPPLPSLHPGDRLPPTNEQIEEAETKAAHEAIKVFATTLQGELDAIGAGGDVLGILGRTMHVHYMVWCDTAERAGCVCRFAIEFQPKTPFTPKKA